jgi:hypothetical protein
MSAMRQFAWPWRVRLLALVATPLIFLSVLVPIKTSALTYKSAPARFWGNVVASDIAAKEKVSGNKSANLEGEKKSEWRITFSGFPNGAKEAVRYAIDVWSRNFESKVPINVEATWETIPNNNVLGSARPGYYFSAFLGAPDDDLWYPSALANALAGRDFDPNQEEIFLKVNSTPLWYLGVDGNPSPRSYDLASVVMHEIAHGLGFLSNAEYDSLFGTGYIFQPTPYDAYVQLPDGRTLIDFCSRSAELGKALTSPLVWSGSNGIAANGGVKPKLYTPSSYEDGSSITHLDEETFSESQANTLMTPNLGPGEVFKSPGPIVLGMLKDMLSKPPARDAVGLPSKPKNIKALVGDKYALITFDSANCSHVDQVTKYVVRTLPGGKEKSFNSQPIRISGLQNGKSYRFTVFAENNKGSSEGVDSNSVKPQRSKPLTVIDNASKVTGLAAIGYQGKPVVVYGDEVTQSLKMATLTGSKWQISTVKRNIAVGPVSLCAEGKGKNASLHAFYGETKEKDLMHSTKKGEKWSHEIVDGDGLVVQDYKERDRTRTASDVSVSNACAITQSRIQVFYRDETQGILLGAVRTKNGWTYEIVDGDKATENRTTGDVALTLDATSLDRTVYLIYDSVLSIDSSRNTTSGEVRVAYRKSIYPEDWKYLTLDGPENGTSIAGYATKTLSSNGKMFTAWLSSSRESLLGPSNLRLFEIDSDREQTLFETSSYGIPSSPLLLSASKLYFGCNARLCSVNSKTKKIELVSGKFKFSKNGAILKIGYSNYLFASQNGRLVVIQDS